MHETTHLCFNESPGSTYERKKLRVGSNSVKGQRAIMAPERIFSKQAGTESDDSWGTRSACCVCSYLGYRSPDKDNLKHMFSIFVQYYMLHAYLLVNNKGCSLQSVIYIHGVFFTMYFFPFVS